MRWDQNKVVLITSHFVAATRLSPWRYSLEQKIAFKADEYHRTKKSKRLFVCWGERLSSPRMDKYYLNVVLVRCACLKQSVGRVSQLVLLAHSYGILQSLWSNWRRFYCHLYSSRRLPCASEWNVNLQNYLNVGCSVDGFSTGIAVRSTQLGHPIARPCVLHSVGSHLVYNLRTVGVVYPSRRGFDRTAGPQLSTFTHARSANRPCHG